MLLGGRRHGVSRGSVSLARCAAGHLPAIAATHPVRNRSRGSISRTTRYTWGRVIRGIFSPSPAADPTETPPPSRHMANMVMPPRPGPSLVLIQPDVALTCLEFGFNAPPGPSHVGQGLQGSVVVVQRLCPLK